MQACLSASSLILTRRTQSHNLVYQANAFVLKAAALNPRPDHGPGFQPGEAFARQPLVMERAVVDAAARAIAGYCARFHQPKALIVFAGDESTFAGPDWFRHAVQAFRGQMPSGCATTFTLQSNGKFLDNSWLDLCAELGISLTITLDSRPARENGFATTGGAGASLDALAAIERIRRHGEMGLFAGVLCVVNPSDDGAALYGHFRSLGITTMDFVMPAEANWDHPPACYTSPTPYADYLIPVFDQWWNENHPDVRIAFFDSLLRSMVGSRVHSDSLGADPLTTVVVGCNGSIEPVDSLRRNGAEAGQPELNVVSHSIECIFQQPTFQKALAGQESLCQTCRKCEIRDVCGGGYLPSRFSQWNGFDNPSIYCADLSKLVRHVVDSCTHQLTATA